MKQKTVRTTISLPVELLEETDRAIAQGLTKSRNEFVARAIKRELAALKRSKIDAELSEMAQDPDYHSEILKMEAEFSTASWEALKIGESQT
jgi:metal-responsive CopG/Arc/MetJ family transcriptional regulator